jgi:signal transduction histidine kinase
MGSDRIMDDADLRLLLGRAALDALERVGLDVEVRLHARSGDAQAAFQQIRERLVMAQERELVKMAALGVIGAGMAHEVRNVMTGVLGFAQVASQKFAEHPDEAKELLHSVERESVRCVQILNNFLHFTRRSEAVRAPVELATVAQSVAGVVEHRAQMIGVRVALELGEDVPPVMADANELRQVLLNLVLNAVQASERGGHVRIATARGHDGWAEVRVADEGRGIAPGDESKLFTPFFTTKPAGQGTGLGLYVSRGIVQEHGGTVAVESAAGRGTTFTVRLPPSGSR